MSEAKGMTKTMTAFALKNIKGRAGRYYHHAMGRVFYTDSKQRQIENADDMQLIFKLMIHILF